MEVLHNSFIGSSVGTALVSSQDEIAAYNEEQEKKDRRSRIWDGIFGVFGKASDVYTATKYGDETKPYDLDVHVGDRPLVEEKRILGLPSPAGYIVIGVGILIIGVIVANQMKK